MGPAALGKLPVGARFRLYTGKGTPRYAMVWRDRKADITGTLRVLSREPTVVMVADHAGVPIPFDPNLRIIAR